MSDWDRANHRRSVQAANKRRRDARINGKPEWQPIRTNFTTQCPRCGRKLPAGTRIAYNPATKQVHCPPCAGTQHKAQST